MLVSNTTGNYNTAYGFAALWFGTGSSNIALGYQAGYYLTTGNNNIDIGALGVAADSGTIRIGTQGTHTATYIAGIAVSSVAGGAPVDRSQSGDDSNARNDVHDVQRRVRAVAAPSCHICGSPAWSAFKRLARAKRASLGRRGAAALAWDSLDLSATWIARAQSISHGR